MQLHTIETISAQAGFAYIHYLAEFTTYFPPTLYFQIASHFGFISKLITKVKHNFWNFW